MCAMSTVFCCCACYIYMYMQVPPICIHVCVCKSFREFTILEATGCSEEHTMVSQEIGTSNNNNYYI